MLWVLIVVMIYCSNKPQTYSVVAMMYIGFLMFNRYYCYLEAQEDEKERLGKRFQKDKFHRQYMQEKRSLIKMEIMIGVMLLLVLQFWIKK